MMVGTFSWRINNYFFIRSDLARSCRWDSTSWAESWILGFMVENKPRRIFFLGFNPYNMAHGPQCMRGAIVCTQIENFA